MDESVECYPDQCETGYWKHIKETLSVPTDSTVYRRCGIELDFHAPDDEAELEARIMAQNDLCAHLGDMVGLSSRLP